MISSKNFPRPLELFGTDCESTEFSLARITFSGVLTTSGVEATGVLTLSDIGLATSGDLTTTCGAGLTGADATIVDSFSTS